MSRILPVLLSVIAISTFGGTANSLFGQQPSAKPPRLHVLTVVDNDSDLQQHVVRDGFNLRKILSEAFATRPHRLVLEESLNGGNATAQNVLAHYRSLAGKIRPNDTLFFYYTGHGATFPNQGGHALTMHHDNVNTRPFLFRRDLRQAMEQLRPRLAVIITDCCSKIPENTRAPQLPDLPKATWPVIDLLFFQHAGFVDINGCQEDALSMCYADQQGPKGGTFTLALVSLLCTKRDAINTTFGTSEGKVAWNQFHHTLINETDRLYQPVREAVLNTKPRNPREKRTQDLVREQRTQTPLALSVAAPAPQDDFDKTWMLGIEHASGVYLEKPVVVVSKVFPETPAAKGGLRIKDIIESIDGIQVTDPKQFDRLLQASDGTVTLGYRCGEQRFSAEFALQRVKPLMK
ncbi:MAG: caspase family protein [Pirellulales bacterium]